MTAPDGDVTTTAETNEAATEIPVSGKNAEDVAAKLVNVPRPLAAMQEFSFHFKKDKLGNKKPTIKLALPIPTLDGVIAALQDEKQQAYILDLISGDIQAAARAQINDDEKPVNAQEDLDLSKLTLNYLANMPKAERTGGGISKETWEKFGEDYLAVMPGVTGKTAEQIGNATKILLAKFQPVKTNKPVITFLKEQLQLWATSTQNLEEYAECYEFLDNKADTLLKMDEASLLANL